MKYRVLVSDNCPKCEIVKQRLGEQSDVEYVSSETPEGKQLIREYRIRSAGTIVDIENKQIVELSKILHERG